MSSHYNIKKSVRKGYYWFVTSNNITYRCFFSVSLTSNNIVGLDLDRPVFSLSFTSKEKLQNVGLDRKVGETFQQIIDRFFTKNPDAILFYICDNSDSRGNARQNRFRRWFSAHNASVKKVLLTADLAGVIHVGAIMLEGNPDRQKIKSYFEKQIADLMSSNKTGGIDELS